MEDAEEGTDLVLEHIRKDEAERARRMDEYAALRETSEFRGQLARMQRDAFAFAQTLKAATLVSSRAPNFVENSFFFRNADDLSSAAIMSALAFREGALGTGRRELRFLLELTVQTAFIDEDSGSADFATKRMLFERRRKPNSADHVKDLSLGMLQDERDKFTRHVVNLWARATSYVHPTPAQLKEKLELQARGIFPGFETSSELAVCADALFKACAAGVVIALHVMGQSFAGDMIVDALDGDEAWPFHASPFVARVDAFFDYKHERKDRLAELAARRLAPSRKTSRS